MRDRLVARLRVPDRPELGAGFSPSPTLGDNGGDIHDPIIQASLRGSVAGGGGRDVHDPVVWASLCGLVVGGSRRRIHGLIVLSDLCGLVVGIDLTTSGRVVQLP